uniref:Uncharacterized protein n=1 Tax=uncultured Prochlorococcus marinus clone HOT0M-10G7 TaxID=379385 RepID=Q1PJL8_PROMR|nr:hypothetical protein HOT0M-10G7_0001 [uncultured Prochlorococcus marinus clone HOT0M-10G7]
MVKSSFFFSRIYFSPIFFLGEYPNN